MCYPIMVDFIRFSSGLFLELAYFEFSHILKLRSEGYFPFLHCFPTLKIVPLLLDTKISSMCVWAECFASNAQKQIYSYFSLNPFKNRSISVLSVIASYFCMKLKFLTFFLCCIFHLSCL